jgi:hypothetical protein
MLPMTRFDEFKASAKGDITAYRDMMQRAGVWEFKESVKLLQELQNKMNHRLMMYMFGTRLGEHLWESYRHQHGACVLRWLNYLNEEFYIYVLHEVKNNRTLYAYC